MSWQAWTESIKGCGFTAGGIFGLDGAVWAQFGETGPQKFNPGDVASIKMCMAQSNPVAAPVHVGGVKQTLMQATDDTIIGKKGTESSIIAVKCNSCIMVGAAGSGSEPRTLLDPLTRLANNLKDSGY